MWSIHPTNCEDVQIRGLNIRSTGGNGDGIDIDSCRRVRIENCDIASGDDCIAIKSGRGSEAYQLLQNLRGYCHFELHARGFDFCLHRNRE